MVIQQSSCCPHITTVGDYTKEEIIRKQQISKCDSCENKGPSLWACLHRDCLYVGCNEKFSDHSTRHYQERNEHALSINLTTLRVWCSICECEVFLENNDPPLAGMLHTRNLSSSKVYVADADSDEEDEVDSGNLKPRGLTGLQNLGNTCYMNSAIQALSNCPQLTNFFLDCGSYVRSEKKPGLSKSYMRLIKEMWHKRRPSYVVPSGIAYGIKMVFPVFRGYAQQDAQEFLRCFMDQLHEDLKEPVVEVSSYNSLSPDTNDDFDSCRGESAIGASEESSQSEFETSGLSSEKISCSEGGAAAAESFNADDDESQNSMICASSNHCGQQLSSHIISQRRNQEINKEMDSSNLSQCHAVCEENTTTVCKGDGASDSGIPCSHSIDVSELGSYTERQSPSSIRRGERHSDYSKYNHGGCISRQCTSQNQSQQRSVSPHRVVNPRCSMRRRKPLQYHSIISDTFDGKILSSVQCLTCDTLSTTKETFQDLSLPIPSRDHHMIHASQGSQQKGAGACTDVYSHQGWMSSLFGWMLSWFWGPNVSLEAKNISLESCLAAYFSVVPLKDDNKYSCGKCKKLRNGIMYSTVLELPEVLCIHLKRFRHEVIFSSKISSYVSFPLEGLDMAPFLHKACPRGVTTYDLAAVICHHGTSSVSGHYTSYGLNYRNDQWYEFDDQYVTAVDPQAVQNCEAYVLFYRKSPVEMITKRQRAVELMEQREPCLLHFHISKQWVNKFNTFAEPGPITNTDFLCAHGGVHPHRAPYVEDLCTVLPQAVWKYLHDTFGGGPACTHLYICPICKAEQESLDKRRRQEHDSYVSDSASSSARQLTANHPSNELSDEKRGTKRKMREYLKPRKRMKIQVVTITLPPFENKEYTLLSYGNVIQSYINVSYADYCILYTDGSTAPKQDLSAYSWYYDVNNFFCSPVNMCSSKQAEFLGVEAALRFCSRHKAQKFLICTDCQVLLMDIEDQLEDPESTAGKLYQEITTAGKGLKMQWVASHVGLRGNEIADYLATCCIQGKMPEPTFEMSFSSGKFTIEGNTFHCNSCQENCRGIRGMKIHLQMKHSKLKKIKIRYRI